MSVSHSPIWRRSFLVDETRSENIRLPASDTTLSITHRQTQFSFSYIAFSRVAYRESVCVSVGPERVLWQNTLHTHPFYDPLDFVRDYPGEPVPETVSGSGISWAICKSAPCPRQITMPAASIPPLSFLQAGCLSCRPTNSVKALKAKAPKALLRIVQYNTQQIQSTMFREIRGPQ